MLSEAICKSNVLLFLGAGATNPLEKPMMKDFMTNLLNIFKKSKDLSDANVLEVAMTYCNGDLEEVLDWCENIKQYAVSIVNAGKRPHDSSIVSPMAQLTGSAHVILDKIKSEIFEQYRLINTDKCKSLFGDLMKYLKEKNSGSIPIFTTNYDPAIEVFSETTDFELINGFRPKARTQQFVWDRTVYDAPASTIVDSVILFKLHGSVNWFKNEKGEIIYSPIATVRPSGGVENMLIWPTKRKIAIHDPFFTAYEYLGESLQNAEFAIFIGYSFRDYDALTKIKSGLIHNDKLKIVIVNPLADKLVKDNFNAFEHKIHKISVPWTESFKADILNKLKTELSLVQN